jgi:formate dehydrogenase subunit delta
MDIARLRYMAEQIAREFVVQGDEESAVAATAEHIRLYWDPRMKAQLLAYARGEGRDALAPVVVKAAEQLG